MGFDNWDEEAQVEQLRLLAIDAVAEFGLELQDLELVLHAYNTTFRVQADDGVFALRVNVNSTATAANIVAQQAWTLALADSSVAVPQPRRSPDGRWFVERRTGGRSFTATLASWLPGDDVGVGGTDPAVLRELGRTAARLHQHARGWQLPTGAALPARDEPLFGDRPLFTQFATDDQQRVIDEALARGRGAFAELRGTDRPIAIHSDLHGGNLKWHDGQLWVFDFDDTGFGQPIVDLAIATFYLRSDLVSEEVVRAGYTEIAELPECSDENFEALLASYQLVLANSLLGSVSASLRVDAERYLDVAVSRLRHWLESGRFELSEWRT